MVQRRAMSAALVACALLICVSHAWAQSQSAPPVSPPPPGMSSVLGLSNDPEMRKSYAPPRAPPTASPSSMEAIAKEGLSQLSRQASMGSDVANLTPFVAPDAGGSSSVSPSSASMSSESTSVSSQSQSCVQWNNCENDDDLASNYTPEADEIQQAVAPIDDFIAKIQRVTGTTDPFSAAHTVTQPLVYRLRVNADRAMHHIWSQNEDFLHRVEEAAAAKAFEVLKNSSNTGFTQHETDEVMKRAAREAEGIVKGLVEKRQNSKETAIAEAAGLSAIDLSTPNNPQQALLSKLIHIVSSQSGSSGSSSDSPSSLSSSESASASKARFRAMSDSVRARKESNRPNPELTGVLHQLIDALGDQERSAIRHAAKGRLEQQTREMAQGLYDKAEAVAEIASNLSPDLLSAIEKESAAVDQSANAAQDAPVPAVTSDVLAAAHAQELALQQQTIESKY